MSAPLARPNEIIDVSPLGPSFPQAKTSVLLKTDSLQVVRLVLPAGKEIPRHQAPGEITVHCLEGRIAFTAPDATQTLSAGQMLYLAPKEFHSLIALEDASVLVTLSLR